ncbi:hypothetical protein BV22DRAFT_390964 [Leucogyrophana mollusca]|uniref:Uncharacterized protein n=1 Tax=Leucogyrophana mollusca TaxID=85980 RepID=A0ACB8BKN3_9AGAM|nr:hypothetical protein BV22DRAFT_390964 [Leucogyrophana mollusca]
MSLFKLSKELVLLILEELEPVSLLRFCQASHLIHSVAASCTALRYRYELALCGMRDGPPSNRSPRVRLEQLLNYKRGWPTLAWSSEDRLRITPPTILGVTGRFLYQASENTLPNGLFQWTLQIYELRSFRSALADPLRHCRFNIPFDIRQVAIDPSQDLMVLAELYFPTNNSAITARLHFLNLWTCHQHHRAAQLRFQFHTDWWGALPPGQRILIQQVVICGSVVGLSVRLEVEEGEATTELVLVNWHTSGPRTRRYSGDLLSFDIINESCLVVVSHPDDEDDEDGSGESVVTTWEKRPDGLYMNERGKRPPQINVYDINDAHDPPTPRIRSYELPESWSTVSLMRISPNSSPRVNAEPTPGAFFYSDPSQRLLVISAEFPPEATPPGCSRNIALVLDESFLQPPGPGEEIVRWNQWRSRCMIFNLPDRAEGLQAVGRRLVFFENVAEPGHSTVDSSSRVHMLDLNPYAVDFLQSIVRSPSPWRWNGPWTTITTVVPRRSTRYIRTSTVEAYNITWIDATEDSIILYNECEGQTSIRILTFGPDPRTMIRSHT